MKNSSLLASTIVLLALLTPGLSLAQQPTEIECKENYIVQANDWLSKIADKYYGDVMAYPAIVDAANADANDNYTDIINPNLIEPGWVLCIPGDQSMARFMGTSTAPVPAGLSLPELANATYSSEWTQDGTAPLTHGEYSESAAPNSVGKTKVVMLTEQTAYGQLNGQDVAAVILVTSTSGSGRFYYLHVMANQNGQPTEVANTLLGDRIQIISSNIENNGIVVDMVQAGPNDPLCCPSQQIVKTFALRGEQLEEKSSRAVASKITETRSSFASAIWKWLGFTDQTGQNKIIVPNPDNYRLELLSDGMFRAKADCRVVSGSYTLSGNNLTVRLDPSAQAKCGSSSLDQQYLSLLGQVVGYEQNGNNLALNLAADGGRMNFSSLQAVTGIIVGPVNATLPAGATLEVKVMDVTETPGTQVEGILQEIVTFPINFEVDYPPQAVIPDHVYALEVSIQDEQGNTLYQNSRTNLVLTQGHPKYNVVVSVKAMK